MEHPSSETVLQPGAFIPRIPAASISLQWRSSSITLWHRSMPKPLGRSLRNSLLKSLLAAWTKASAPASPHASTNATAPTSAYAHAPACPSAPAHATWKLRHWFLRADATAKQMPTECWTSNGPTAWSNRHNRLWCFG